MHRQASAGRLTSGGKPRRQGTRKLTLQRSALLLLLGAVVASFTSIPLFLAVLHGVDSYEEGDAPAPGVSIQALHVLQQAKARAMHASLMESTQRLALPCIDEAADLKRSARYLLPADMHILESSPLPVSSNLAHRQQPRQGSGGLSSKGGVRGEGRLGAGRDPVGSSRGLEPRRGLGLGRAEGSGQKVSAALGDAEGGSGLQEDLTGQAGPVQVWEKGGKMCRRWVTRFGDRLGDAGNDSFLVGLQYFLGSDSQQEPRREGWSNESSLAGALLEVEPITMALGFWGRVGRGPEGTNQGMGSQQQAPEKQEGFVSGWPSQQQQQEGDSTGDASGWRELARVETLRRGARQQMELGGTLHALAPETTEVLAVEVCAPGGMPLLEGNQTRGLGVQLSLSCPSNATAAALRSLPPSPTNTERKLHAVKKRCELRQAPLLRYVVPAGRAWDPPPGLEGLPAPLGQLAVSWESNCNAVRHQVAICRGDVGPCWMHEEKDCEVAEEPLACHAEQVARNRTFPQPKEPDIIIGQVATIQVSATRWLHSVRLPPLPPGGHRYRVRSGGKWSHLFSFRVVPPPVLGRHLAPPLEEAADPKLKKTKGRMFKTRGEMLRRRAAAKRSEPKRGTTGASKLTEGGVGKKGALSRKGYERGPIGVSLVNTELEDWLHVAIVSDSQGGVSTFRRHLSHIRAHKPAADLLVHAGDRVQQGASQHEWAHNWNFPLSDSGVGQQTPHLGVYGNHDLDEFGLAWAFAPLASQTTWSSLVVGNCLWIGLDSNVSPVADASQGEWLKETLQNVTRARAEGVSPAFVVVVVHIPPFVDYWDPKAWVKGEERHWGEWVRLEWVPLFEKYKVDLVISGHSHVYQRGERNGVMYAILGGGGGALDRRRVEDWGMYKVTYLGYHYVWMDVSASKLSWTAYDIANNPIDHVLFEPEDFTQ